MEKVEGILGMNQCPFCNRLMLSEPLFVNEHCQIIPDISPLLPGHVLIIPFDHTEGMARCREEVFASIMEAIGVALSRYGNFATIFEHGALHNKNAGSSISHAHIHIIPGRFDLSEEIESTLLIESVPLRYEQLNAAFLKDKAYLFVQNDLTTMGKCYLVGELPRQYLRAMFLRQLRQPPLFDWEINSGTPEAKRMVQETIALWK